WLLYAPPVWYCGYAARTSGVMTFTLNSATNPASAAHFSNPVGLFPAGSALRQSAAPTNAIVSRPDVPERKSETMLAELVYPLKKTSSGRETWQYCCTPK